MAQKLVKTIAQFSTTLVTKTAVGATTGTLTSGLDIEGIQLPTGTYGFLVDRKNSSKEFFTATLTGAALTNIQTITVGTGVGTAGLLRTHRKGAEVIITDHVAIKRMMNVLDGTTSFDSATPLGYDGTASITTANQFATKAYADGLAIAGSPDSSTTVKGIGKVSVAPASAATPIFVGDNDTRVPPIDTSTMTANIVAALAGTGTPNGTTGKYVTNDDTATAATASKVARRLAGGNITVVTESSGNNSTNAASTAYVDATVLAFKNGTDTKNAADASTTQNIAHGLGKTPKRIRIRAVGQLGDASGDVDIRESNTVYNGTTQSSVSVYRGNGQTTITDTTFTLNLASSAGATTTQTGVITWDATNIIITWTKTGSPTGTYTLLWEAEG